MSHAYLNDLNDAQRAAVCYDEGPALVIAGAGSGKTRVLVYKLLYLLDQGYAPHRLMALTFTNKAAREMRSRIELLGGSAARYIQMGTFHSIFLRILRTHADRLGYTSVFSIYNTSDSRSRIKAIIKLLSLDDSQYRVNAIHSRISNAKNHLITPEGYRASDMLIQADVRANLPRFVDIYTRYWYDLRQSNAMDFDDLLLQTHTLLREHPDVLSALQERIDYLLIDEYQDTNLAQYSIARLLMKDRGRIFVVGDDAQSIYSFRGANIKNILNFQEAFPGTRLFKLEQNYRSSQTIVKAAGSVIGRNEHQIAKQVFSLGDVGEPIELHEALTGDLEATWVCHRIEELRRQHAEGYDHFAVLYRTNAQSRTLEQVFRRQGVPFRIWGGRSFYDHREVMDAMAYLRLVVNPTDEEALLRVINYPKRGIGDTTVERLRTRAVALGCPIIELLPDAVGRGVEVARGAAARLAAFAGLVEEMRTRMVEQGDSLYELAQWILSRSGIMADLAADTSIEGRGRMENLRELLTGIEEYERNCREQDIRPSLGAYISEVALMTDQDSAEDDQPSVTLMTIHAAKGLEFPHVFIVGLEEMLFPSAMSADARGIEEERRLFYVALTRAERTCHIGYALERFRNGRTEYVRPSRFVYELPAELLRRTATTGGGQTLLSAARPRRHEADALPKSFSSEAFLPPPSARAGRQVHLARRDADAPTETRHQRIGDLSVGCRVLHGRFGEGGVIALEGEGDNAKATVRFAGGDDKKLLLRFANLRRL